MANPKGNFKKTVSVCRDISFCEPSRLIQFFLLGLLIVFGAANLFSADLDTSMQRDKTDSLQWKMVWAWTMSYKTEKDIELGVQQAKALGFNAMEWTQANPEIFVRICRKYQIESYCVLSPGSKIKQELKPTERDLPINPHKGGEPITKNDIGKVISGHISCFRQPDALVSAKNRVRFAVEKGYTGIALDFVGYRNYHGCFCSTCCKARKRYLERHPGMSKEEAEHRFSEEALIQFYENVITYAKSIKPTIKTTCHIYPVFLRNILYGNRLPVDYCGQTVSWFFKPHWSLEKIERYSKIVVEDGSLYHSSSIGTPFIGIYGKGKHSKDAKTPERIREEIQIVKNAGAKGIQFAELGHILDDPEVANVIAEELGGVKTLGKK